MMNYFKLIALGLITLFALIAANYARDLAYMVNALVVALVSRRHVPVGAAPEPMSRSIRVDLSGRIYGRRDPRRGDCHRALGRRGLSGGHIHCLPAGLSRAQFRMGARACQFWPAAPAAYQRRDLCLWR